MKKLTLLVITTLLVVSCKKKDYVSFSGKIENKNSDSIVISNPQKKFNKVIKVLDDGTFKDTLKVDKGVFLLSDGKESQTIFLKNGDEIVFNVDASDFKKTTLFSGKGAAESNFLVKTIDLQGKLREEMFTLLELPKEEFDAKFNKYLSDFREGLDNELLDSAFAADEKDYFEKLEKRVIEMHEDKLYVKTNLAKGKPSPKFANYEDFERELVSLDDFLGKYVYIDLWATWCKPCTAEFPFLKAAEEKYHDKNVEFVSISIDREEDYFEWHDMVEAEGLGGVQLFAKDKTFTDAYRVNSIPRFILIDPEGNIVDNNAPRPSDPKFVELFDSLEI